MGGTEHFRRVRKLFDEALTSGPERRRAMLAAAAQEDPALAAEIKALLDAHDQAQGFLKSSVHGTSPREIPDLKSWAGRQLGPWRLERVIGSGGMGVVYLGRRADGAFEQEVAVKLLAPGCDMAPLLPRFILERQTLARLQHPNIARLLDGGTSASGVPWMVMEYVQGEPIDRWCNGRRLGVDERLRLFLKVCDAVAYAHRQLVIHRDIKPDNILVTADGTIKLLDFGIAKILPTGDEAGNRPMTLTQQRLLTPGYGSPEQMQGRPISTASDLYSLGVVLYELLTGTLPHLPPGRSGADIPATDLRYAATPPPSSRLQRRAGDESDENGLMPGLRQVEAARGTTAERLRRRLTGDLDTIVLMALRPEPERRYASVEQFADDIRRHLEGLPVSARADSRTYLLGRFLRRHRLGVTAAVLVVFSLLAGLATTVWQAKEARHAHERAELRFGEVRELANALLFEVHDEVAVVPGTTRARHRLVERALIYLDRLAADAEDDFELQAELAASYERIADILGRPGHPNLGRSHEAFRAYATAMELRRRLAQARPGDPARLEDLARAGLRLGTMQWWTGDTPGAREHIDESIHLSRRLLESDPTRRGARLNLAEALLGLANLQSWAGALEVALANLDESRHLLEELVVASEEPRFEVRHLLVRVRGQRGVVLMWADAGERAREELKVTLELLRDLRADHPGDARIRRTEFWARFMYAKSLEELDWGLARDSYREVLALASAMAGDDPHDTQARRDLATSHANLGDALARTGESEPGLEQYRRAREIFAELAHTLPAVRFDLANTAKRVGDALLETGDLAGALTAYREALEIRTALFGEDPADDGLRRNVAVDYGGVARASEALAGVPGLPTNQRLEYLAAARDAYSRSAEFWRQHAARGLVMAWDADKPGEMAAGLARVETALSEAAR